MKPKHHFGSLLVYCAYGHCFFDLIKCFTILTLSYTGFFRLVKVLREGEGGRGHKVPAAFFCEALSATAIKPGTLTN